MNKTSVAAMVGLLALGVSVDAKAQCSSTTYHPAAYTNSAAGDVALTAAQSQLVNGMLLNLGLHYGHASVLYDNSGHVFTESTVGNGTPPSSLSTGEPHVCTKVLSPYYTQRLSPGVVNHTSREAVAGVLVKGGARAGCVAPADTYHINSIKYRHRSGSCAALAEDDCGAAVTGPWQITFTPAQHYAEAVYIYTAAYKLASPICTADYPSYGCGSTGALGECYGLNDSYGYECSSCADRAASQVVNEFATPALAFSTTMNDGWTDYSVFNELLGGAKNMGQAGHYWYNGGFVNTGSNWTPRVPDNIYASAATKGHAIVVTNIAAGYYSTTNSPNGTSCSQSCSGGACTGTCSSGSCAITSCSCGSPGT